MLKLTYKMDLKRGDIHVALSDLSICYTSRNVKEPYRNNIFKISGTTNHEIFEILSGSYSALDIQKYLE